MYPLILATTIVAYSSASDGRDLKSNEMTARCRSYCLYEFLKPEEYALCDHNFECSTCWDTCGDLYDRPRRIQNICTEGIFCDTGCQKSCDFLNSRTAETNLVDMDIDVDLRYDLNSRQKSGTLRWTNSKKDVPLVFVIDAYNQEMHTWNQLGQTPSENLTMSDLSLDLTRFRLTAYTSDALLFRTESSSRDEIREHLLRDEQFKEKRQPIEFAESWSPQIYSLQYSRELLGTVDAIVRWTPLREEVERYEVTWKLWEHSFETTGVLRTLNTLVKIPLWPNSAYTLVVTAHLEGRKVKIVQGNTIVINTSETLLGPNPFDRDCEDDRETCLRTDYLISFALAVTATFLFGFVLYLLTEKKPRQWARNTIKRSRERNHSSFKKTSLKEQHDLLTEKGSHRPSNLVESNSVP